MDLIKIVEQFQTKIRFLFNFFNLVLVLWIKMVNINRVENPMKMLKIKSMVEAVNYERRNGRKNSIFSLLGVKVVCRCKQHKT